MNFNSPFRSQRSAFGGGAIFLPLGVSILCLLTLLSAEAVSVRDDPALSDYHDIEQVFVRGADRSVGVRKGKKEEEKSLY